MIETVHSSHTSQLMMALKLLEREMGEEKLPFFFFFNRLGKRPLRYFFTDSKESEVEQTPGDREGQESLACCSP